MHQNKFAEILDDTADMGKKLLELSASNTRDAVHRNVKAHYDFLSKVAKETKKNLDQDLVYTHKHANDNQADTWGEQGKIWTKNSAGMAVGKTLQAANNAVQDRFDDDDFPEFRL